MNEHHQKNSDGQEQEHIKEEGEQTPAQLIDYLLRTRQPQENSEDIEEAKVPFASSRPRHRLLIEQALASHPNQSSLASPQGPVTRWKIPTGALVILALILSGFALWSLLGGAGGNSEVLAHSSVSTQEKAKAPASHEPRNSASKPVKASPSDDTVIVHITGQVVNPGLYHLKPGSRINDALTAAGGPTPTANTSAVNLAQIVKDGSQIYIPAAGEQIAPSVAHSPALAEKSSSASSAETDLVNLNTADADELQKLPKVGPVLAQAIISWREEHGGFQSVDELDQVSGVGPATLEKLRPLVTV